MVALVATSTPHSTGITKAEKMSVENALLVD
jgi:hypothetical protein